jgi:hypothetical protein
MNQVTKKNPKQLKANVNKHLLRDSQWNLLIFALVLLWSFLLGCTYMRSTDIWWHLKTGMEMMSRGEIPKTDWFTTTSTDRPWIDLHWGFQLLVTVVFKMGNVSALVLLKAFCLSLTVLLGWQAVDSKLSSTWKSVFWIPAIICISGRAVVRPEMLTLVFLAMELLILKKAEKRIKLLWLIPIIQVVWLNCHALFILGLIVSIAWGMDQEWKKWLVNRTKTNSNKSNDKINQTDYSFQVWTPILVAVLVSLLNPYFFQGAIFPFELYKKFSTDQVLYSGIAEFQPPWEFVMRSGWGNLYLLSELFLWLITASTFVLLLVYKKGSLFRWVLFLAFSHLAWQASRNTSIFVVVMAVIGSQNLLQFFIIQENRQLEKSKAKSKKKKRNTSTHVSTLNKSALAISVLLVVLNGSVLSGYWTQLGKEGKYFSIKEQPDWYIHEAAIFAGQDGMPEEAFVSNIGQAAVYLYHNGPENKVFMDGRLEVASNDTYRAYITILDMMKKGDPNWLTVFHSFRVKSKQKVAGTQNLEVSKENLYPLVLLDSRYSRLELNGMMQLPDWRLVFADGTAGVFLHKSIADQLNLPLVDHSKLLHPTDITK